jgi:hypothetical protein
MFMKNKGPIAPKHAKAISLTVEKEKIKRK